MLNELFLKAYKTYCQNTLIFFNRNFNDKTTDNIFVDIYQKFGDKYLAVSYHVETDLKTVSFYHIFKKEHIHWHIESTHIHRYKDCVYFEKDGYYFILYEK